VGSAIRTGGDAGSIIIIVATDAPLLPHQLKASAKRARSAWEDGRAWAGTPRGHLHRVFTGNPRAAVDTGLATIIPAAQRADSIR